MQQKIHGIIALVLLAGLAVLAVLSVGLPHSVANALLFIALFGLLALVQTPATRPLLLAVSGFVIIRYIAWRFESFPVHGGLPTKIAATALLAAELYCMGVVLLGYFVSVRPIERQPLPLPTNPDVLPLVDVYIPTYSEPLSVVAPTVCGAVEIDYPKDRFRVHVLDDGFPRSKTAKSLAQRQALAERATQLKALCERHGAIYLTRESNEHAKSGNLNAALQNTSGELIVILDADHVPTRDFLRSTVGFFMQDPKAALVQTPHFFTNPDPLEKNLGLFNQMPAENDLFYRVVQPGLDTWNASFFCGSGAVVRRAAIMEVGGFSTDSITEDASTSVKLHQRGWRSVYFGRPMVAGLQPETISGFLVQRIRWGVGMMQILMKQNPWLVRGLTPVQRFCYFSVGLFWFFPFARLVTFLVPIIGIVFKLQMYPGGTDNLLSYTLPFLTVALLTAERLNGRFRRIFSSELYETLQAFYMLPALASALARPNAPTFSVTPKGEQSEADFISEFRLPFYGMFVCCAIGLVWGIVRMVHEPESRPILAAAVLWIAFNLFLSFGALGALFEKAQRRARPRIDINEPITVSGEFGEQEVLLLDANELGLRVRVPDGLVLDRFEVRFQHHLLAAYVIPPFNAAGNDYVALYAPRSPEEERAAVILAYGNSDRWVRQWKRREASVNFIKSLLGMLAISLRGAHAHARHVVRKGFHG
ncbi:UDP-forming cellulose synthase catalytic subunit [Trinickia mobilis]|uniref:UDP-forming cellulose synthase catalytic subunit n=1 Tax=Trinickia mobilis TaxID=2816356 RepID=UPI001A8DFF1D|nr:UDP-forming cellulose synthase catalytic subunit [Trinickia mobilis]